MDYAKLKVVDLKAELKKRGLPQSGLKQALIERLQTADTQSQEPVEEALFAVDHIEHVERTQPTPTQVPDTAPTAPQSATPVTQTPPGPEVTAPLTSTAAAPESTLPTKDAVSSDVAPKTDIVPAPTPSQPVPTVEEPTQDNLHSEPPSQSANGSRAVTLSTQTSLNPGEATEDRRKRKRRSQSPPPSAEAIAQKKARQEAQGMGVTLKEDMEIDPEPTADIAQPDIPDQQTQTTVNVPTETTQQKEEPATSEESLKPLQETMPLKRDTPTEEESSRDPIRVSNDVDSQQEPAAAQPSPSSQPPQKPATTKDTRFKGLFQAKQDGHQPPTPTRDEQDDERTVEPAVHPATSALYIRDFMRPLHPPSLKEHLIKLATPPQSSPNPDILSQFYLDPIRTHCLALFTSVSAASRVRSALHNRVWPDERTRRPLWADFIPDEKIDEWIEVEQSMGGSRPSQAKKWEVVYEKATPSDQTNGEGVQAILQEVGSGGPSISTHPGVKGAPLGPRSQEVAERNGTKPAATSTLQAPRPGESGFNALDSLFKSTAAKPKLYYLPRSKDEADKRIESLQDHVPRQRRMDRGRGRGWELRRFTFEGSDLVDRGPEFGSGYRGGNSYRGRGGFAPRAGGRSTYGRDRRDRW